MCQNGLRSQCFVPNFIVQRLYCTTDSEAEFSPTCIQYFLFKWLHSRNTNATHYLNIHLPILAAIMPYALMPCNSLVERPSFQPRSYRKATARTRLSTSFFESANYANVCRGSNSLYCQNLSLILIIVTMSHVLMELTKLSHAFPNVIPYTFLGK